MAYVDPPTFVASDPLAAAELNVLGDDIVYLYSASEGTTFSGVRVGKASATSVADSTDVPITFTSENWDYGGWWSSGTNVVVPAGAVPAGFTSIALLVTAHVDWDHNGVGTRALSLVLNGTAFARSAQSGIVGESILQTVTDLVVAEAGDILTLEVTQTSGGNLNADTAHMTVVRFAPTE